MTFSTGIKGVFDYSVFTASAGAFALSWMKDKHMKLDILLKKIITIVPSEMLIEHSFYKTTIGEKWNVSEMEIKDT